MLESTNILISIINVEILKKFHINVDLKENYFELYEGHVDTCISLS